jgi:uncharacterized protein YndB with AHSA1/START domain
LQNEEDLMTASTKSGELAVRRSIQIDAPPERVWQEFASQERMSQWYTTAGGVEMGARRLAYEPRVGGIFETEGVHAGVTSFLFTGKVLVFEPPRELTVEMGAVRMGDDPPNWPAPTLVTFLLTRLEGDRCSVEIVHHGFEALGDIARDMYDGFEGGWNLEQVKALRSIVETGRAR